MTGYWAKSDGARLQEGTDPLINGQVIDGQGWAGEPTNFHTAVINAQPPVVGLKQD